MSVTAALLRYWRLRRGLSQRELAEKSGLSQAVISKYENQHSASGIPSETLEAIVSNGLEITMAGFYGQKHIRRARAGGSDVMDEVKESG